MRPVVKVRVCLVLNVALLTLVVALICTFATDNAYFRWGPHPDFVLISIRIDTNARYAMLLSTIALMNCIKVLVAELGEPVLVFNVYNPDKRTITDFSKRELLLYANAMFFLSNTRRAFDVIITVTQFDIAIFSVCVEQLVSTGTVYALVQEKRFDHPIWGEDTKTVA